MGPGMFDRLGTFIGVLIVTCVISAPLALWKLIDIVRWACTHIKIGVE